MKKIFSIFIILSIFFSISVEASAAIKTTSTTSSSANTSATSAASISVATPKSFVVTETLHSVKLSWKRNKNATGYIVSRSTDKETWHKVKTIKSNKTVSYIDNSASEDVLYYYSIKAYKKHNGKTYFSTPASTVPIYFGVNFYISSYEDNVALSWQKVAEAKGYEIYFSTDSVNFSRIKRIKKNSLTTYTKTELIKPYKTKYYFYIKVYNVVNNKRNYIYQSETLCSSSIKSLINGSVAKPKSNFKTYNVQGKKAYMAYKISITSSDKKIFNDFNSNYLSSDMSPYARIYYTFMFIHKKVTYASGGLYSKIENSTYADAIFNKRIGQCAQYNGAMVEYLANLGFSVKLIWGYRGTSMNNKWQHFWGQVKLQNGVNYVIETGNYGNDGDWYYFFKPYKETKKFLKCGKYVSGIKA